MALRPRAAAAGGQPPAGIKQMLSDVYAEYLATSDRYGAGESEESINVVRYCLTGTESCGKTALLEDLVGHKLGFTEKGTATRCPVRYHLKQSDRSSFRMDNRELGGFDSLAASMKAHMERIKQSKTGFSSAVANVTISAPSINGNLVVTDLPGLITSVGHHHHSGATGSAAGGRDDERSAASSVRRMVAAYVRDERVTPIVMVKPGINTGQLLGLDMVQAVFEDPLLDGVGPPRMSWRSDCVAAMNKLDKLFATKDLQCADELFGLARGLRDSGFRDWFLLCARAPRPGPGDAGSGGEGGGGGGAGLPQRWDEWTSDDIRQAAELERSWFCRVVETLPDFHDDPDGAALLQKMFGIRKLQQMLDRRWMSSMVNNIIPIKEFFRRRVQHAEEQLGELHRRQAMESPDAMRALMNEFLEVFVDQIKAMHSGSNVAKGPAPGRVGEHCPRGKFARHSFHAHPQFQVDFAEDECHVQRPTVGGDGSSGQVDYRNLVHTVAARRVGGGNGGGAAASSAAAGAEPAGGVAPASAAPGAMRVRGRSWHRQGPEPGAQSGPRARAMPQEVWPGYLFPAKLQEILNPPPPARGGVGGGRPPQKLGRNLDAALVGLQRIERIVNVMSFMSLRHASASVRELSDATIAATAMDPTIRYSVGDKSLQLAADQLRLAEPAVRWMCAGIFYVVSSYLEPVFANILSHAAFEVFRPGAPCAPFVATVEGVFLDLLNAELTQVEDSYSDHVETVEMGCRDDELSRELEGLLIMPVEHVALLSPGPDQDQDRRSGRRGRDSDAATEARVSESEGSGDDHEDHPRAGAVNTAVAAASAPREQVAPPRLTPTPTRCSVCKMSLGSPFWQCKPCEWPVCSKCKYSKRSAATCAQGHTLTKAIRDANPTPSATHSDRDHYAAGGGAMPRGSRSSRRGVDAGSGTAGSDGKTTAQADAGGSGHETAKVKALRSLCRALTQHRNAFTLADYVEGGLLTPVRQDLQAEDHGYVRDCTAVFVALMQRKVDVLTRGKVVKHVHCLLGRRSRFRGRDLRRHLGDCLRAHMADQTLQQTYKAVDTSVMVAAVQDDLSRFEKLLGDTETLIEHCLVWAN